MAKDAKTPEPYRPHWLGYARQGDGDALWLGPGRRLGLWLGLSLLFQAAAFWLAGVGFGLSWLLLASAVLTPALLFAVTVAPQRAHFSRALLLGLVASAMLLGAVTLAVYCLGGLTSVT